MLSKNTARRQEFTRHVDEPAELGNALDGRRHWRKCKGKGKGLRLGLFAQGPGVDKKAIFILYGEKDDDRGLKRACKDLTCAAVVNQPPGKFDTDIRFRCVGGVTAKALSNKNKEKAEGPKGMGFSKGVLITTLPLRDPQG